jgi:cytochrome P450
MGFYDSINTINNFVSGYIETAVAMSSEEEADELGNNATRYNFLHAIAGYTNDRLMLRDQLVSTLLAGCDTTACTLTWAIYHSSMEPHIIAKLCQEIIDAVGYERISTYQDLKDMKYLQNIMKETLRLYYIVPYNVHVALIDTTLPTGGGKNGQQKIGILKGTQIAYSPLVMQRRKDLYPLPETGFPVVEQFVPERWDNWTPRSWTYIPFNNDPM